MLNRGRFLDSSLRVVTIFAEDRLHLSNQSKLYCVRFALSLRRISITNNSRATMRNEVKLKIGAFSKMMQVTVKTLRHYEQMGLLIPYEVDKWAGYRYAQGPLHEALRSLRPLL